MIIVFFWFCSINPETAVTFTRDHYNQVVFAVKRLSVSVAKQARDVANGLNYILCN